MRVEFKLRGCDASTYLEMEVTVEELAFLKRLEQASKEASSYNCEPTLEILEHSNNQG